jgi:hypothetical protein
MTGVSCLVKNTVLLQDLKDLVEYIGYERVSNGKSASVGEIYNIIRQSGIEIDLQSIGYIYNDTLPKSYQNFQSDQEVNDFILNNYKDAIDRATKLEDKEGEEQIGEDKPEIFLVNGILNMFTNANVADETTESDMLKMQNALWKGIQRKLKLPESEKPATKQGWKDILNQALGYEKLGLTDISGKLNSISDLYEGMRQQLADAGKELIQKGDYADVERWFDMVDSLQASTYNLLFSKGEAKELLEGMMKEAGFTKKSGDKTILNWNKLAGDVGSVQDLRSNVQRVLEGNGFNQSVIDGVKDSLENEFNNLHAKILEKAEKELSNREDAVGVSPGKKSDLRRLAELNNLGIFESAHDKLLNHIIGVSDLQAEDLEDLKHLANAASNLYREIDKKYGSDIFASRHLQTIQRSIDSIIARNINNKTGWMKIVAAAKRFFDVLMTGLLMRPFTLLENIISGSKEIAVPAIMGRGLKKEDWEVYRKMLSDVSIRGQAFGEEIGNFAPKELYTNMLKWNWGKGLLGQGTTLKDKANSLLYAVMLPGRIGLLGFDSANKVTITNKVFNNAVYKSLTQQGKTSEEANKLMNEALYGKSFEDAKTQAKELMEKINNDLPDKYKIPINSRTITTFANDLVKANLNADGALKNEVVEAAYKSAYHVAGYGLGHEPNNIVSSQIKGYRDRRRREEQRLMKDKNWNQLAKHRAIDTFVNSMVLRFTGGATNWVILRLQSGLGLGLAQGFLGKWNRDIDFKDESSIKESIKERENRRNQIGRSLVGISYTLFAYIIGYSIYRGGDDDEKVNELNKLKENRKKMADQQAPKGYADVKAGKLADMDSKIKTIETSLSPYRQIKSDYMKNRLFKKVSPDLMLINYYLDTEKSNLMAVLNYTQQATGLGSDFSTAGRINSASQLAYRGNDDAAKGELASIAGDRVGFPVWQAYKDWFKLFQWGAGFEVSSDFKKPTNFSEGLWGGGVLEDLGFFKRDSKITNLPGIGAQGYEKFKAKGIETMSDLKKTDKWWEMKAIDDEGNVNFIIRTATDRIKAKEAFEKYQKQN